MSEQHLAEIEARLRAATSLWFAAIGSNQLDFSLLSSEDTAFIKHAPTDTAALLAEVRRLQELNAGLIGDLADMVNQHCPWQDGFIHGNALSADKAGIDRLVTLGVLQRRGIKPLRYEWVGP